MGMRRLYPNRENSSVEELEKYIKLSKSAKEKTRLLSIQMLWLGLEALKVSEILCVSDVSVYKWVHRFNLSGLEGLLHRERTGRPRLVKSEEFRELINIFDEPELVGKRHWSAKKFHAYLVEDKGFDCSYTTVLGYLKKENYVMKYGRSWPDQPEGNEQKRIDFIADISGLKDDTGVRLWFMDEAGFAGDPRPRRGWSLKGERKKIYRTQKHLRMNVSAMVCPETGEFFALEFPYSNRDSFQAFLDVAQREIKEVNGRKDIIVLDNASWHKTKIEWGRFNPLFLPPYSPDLNPIERIWGYLKQEFFHSFSAKNIDELIAQLDIALCHLIDNPNIASSITAKF